MQRTGCGRDPAKRLSIASLDSRSEGSLRRRRDAHRLGGVPGVALSLLERTLSGVQSIVFHVSALPWTSVSLSVWRVLLSFLGACACWTASTWVFTLLGFLIFLLLKTYTTSPPLAVFPVYFDYIPALSEALSKSALEGLTIVDAPQHGRNSTRTGEFCSPAVYPGSFTEPLSVPFLSEVQSQDSGSVGDKPPWAGQAGHFQRHLFVSHSSPVPPGTCPPPQQPVGGSLFMQEPNTLGICGATPGVWTGKRQPHCFAQAYSIPGENADCINGTLPFFHFSASSSVAIAAVPFSNRSWEFIPYDIEMYVPPLPLSQLGKNRRNLRDQLSSHTSIDTDHGGLPVSFFVNLNKSRLPKDHHLDVFLTLSYPLSDHNKHLPPVMFSVMLFTPDHRPIAKATRPFLTSGVVRDAGMITGSPEVSCNPFSFLSTVTQFAPAFLRDGILGLAGGQPVAASIVFFESFPVDLIPHLKYAQVLMYPPLHVSTAGLIMAPKLHGVRFFLASHWASMSVLVTFFLLCSCVLCACCGTVGCTYLAFSVSSSEEGTELRGSNFRTSSRACTERSECSPGRPYQATSPSAKPLSTCNLERASKICKLALTPTSAGYQPRGADDVS